MALSSAAIESGGRQLSPAVCALPHRVSSSPLQWSSVTEVAIVLRFISFCTETPCLYEGAMLAATCVMERFPTPVPSAPRTTTRGSATVRGRRRPRASSRCTCLVTASAKLLCATLPVASMRSPHFSCSTLIKCAHPRGPLRGAMGCGKFSRFPVQGLITHGRGRSCLPTR